MYKSVINKFIIKDIYNHKKDNIIAAIIIFIAGLIVFSFTCFSQVSSKNHLTEYQYNRGTYTYYTYDIENVDEIYLNGVSTTLDKIPHAYTYTLGMDMENNVVKSYRGDEDIIGLHLIKGDFPQNKNEVIVKESYLKTWGYEPILNETITIAYNTLNKDNEVKLVDLIIVGILDENCFYDIMLSHDDEFNVIKGESKLCIETDISDKLYSPATDISYNSDINEIYNTSMSPYLLTFIEFLSFIIPFTLVYGIILSSFDSKQKDYTLLRSIGITKRQLYYVVFMQSVIISLIPILLSLILVLLFMFINKLEVSLLAYVWTLFKLYSIIIVSFLLPAFQSQRRSLVGAFENNEHSYIYYRYKRLHKLTPMYLGWRQIVLLKKKSVIKVILLAISIFFIVQISLSIVVRHCDFADTTLIKKLTTKEVGEYVGKENLGIIGDYASDISFLPYFFSGDYENHLSNIENWFEFYALTKETKDYFHIERDLEHNEYLINGKEKGSYNGMLSDLYKKVEKNYTYYVFINEEDFYSLTQNKYNQKIIIFFDSMVSKRELLITHAKEYLDILKNQNISKRIIDNLLEDKNNYSMYRKTDDKTLIGRTMLIIIIGVIYIYTSAFELYKSKEDIGTYQLLGLRVSEMMFMYLSQVIVIILIGFALGGCAAFLELIYNYGYIHDWYFYIIPIFMCVLIMLVIGSIALIPMIILVRRNAFENRLTRD